MDGPVLYNYEASSPYELPLQFSSFALSGSVDQPMQRQHFCQQEPFYPQREPFCINTNFFIKNEFSCKYPYANSSYNAKGYPKYAIDIRQSLYYSPKNIKLIKETLGKKLFCTTVASKKEKQKKQKTKNKQKTNKET